jgi:hypothetical protein
MQAAFPVVLFSSIGLFVLMGMLSMLNRDNLHDQIGQGGMFLNEDQEHTTLRDGTRPEPPGAGLESPTMRVEREQEIRQMLRARSDRLVRQGQAPLDIDSELARLQWADTEGFGDAGGPGSHDARLTDEVRQLVRARNERRQRQGLDLLDVETEVRRTLAELDP